MQSVEAAYIAGLFDGEGCFYGHLVNKANANGGNVEVRIAVQANSMAMIEKLKDFYDGLGVRYSLEIGRLQKGGNRPCHKISVHRKADIKILLNAVLPFLAVKKPEAELILEWLEKWGHDLRGANQWTGPRGPGLDERGAFLNSLSYLKKVA